MNSKELLEQARERAEKQLGLAKQIEDAENMIGTVKDGFICFYVVGRGSVRIDDVVDFEKLDAIKELGLVAIMNFKDDRTAELEKLLGIQAEHECILPAFGSGGIIDLDKLREIILTPDPVEVKLTDILQSEAKKIEDEPVIPEASLEKYPAKSKKKSTYPEGMTVEAVRKMYIDEGKTINEVAKHFGVNYSKANNFISANKLSRTHYDKIGKKPEKQPEETERPLQS